MHRRSYKLLPLLRCNLLIITFKFNCKSDFTIMNFFFKFSLTLNSKFCYFVIGVHAVIKKFTFKFII